VELAKAGVKIAREISLPWKHSVFLQDPDGMLSEWYVAKEGKRDLSMRGDLALAMAV
jgi:catechol 2,3-dioxygenase